MISLTNVSKKWDGFWLKPLSIELPKGYILGLIGPNGAGKTTLLHLLLHLYFPDEGKIEFCGKTYDEDEVSIKNEIGYVLSEELFSGELTLLENAELYGKYYVNYDRALLSDYLSMFSLDMDKQLKMFSKGEKLKFQFAFALSHKPKLLILDEPTANFDPEFRGQFLHLVTEFVADGEHSVILATHLTGDLDKIADYLLFLYQGEVLLYDEREAVLDQYRIVSGERYKIMLLPKEKLVFVEEGEWGCRALVRHSRLNRYAGELEVRRPTIEELMYYLVHQKGCVVYTV